MPVDRVHADAAQAVHAEHRASCKTVRLRCQRVERLVEVEGWAAAEDGVAADDRAEWIYALDVTRFAQLDWSWEGARVHRWLEEEGPGESGAESDVEPGAAGRFWVGEVVELDEVESRLYVKVPGPAPVVGDLAVQPFDFLESLRLLYEGPYALALEPHLTPLLRQVLGASPPRRIARGSTSWDESHPWAWSFGCVWGPPGTGKTYTVGEHVAAALADPSEHILVVSTTNRATDLALISIVDAQRRRGVEPTTGLVSRVGGGVDARRLRAAGAAHLLDEADVTVREELADLLEERQRVRDPETRARLWARAQQLRRGLSAGGTPLGEVRSRVVVTTAFGAIRGVADGEVASAVAAGRSRPFTTIVIDEAGLISRASAAALGLWASRRVVLVGDPRQLSPISRMSRVLEPRRAMWIAKSGLDHLEGESPGVALLREQHRMHPDIRAAVSGFSYGGALLDAPGRSESALAAQAFGEGARRAVWHVLDDALVSTPHRIRADRGPGGRSWVRVWSMTVLERLLAAHPELAQAEGLFITPFVAQARAVQDWLLQNGCRSWRASTTHAQQGAEADVVVFDTVHASSTGWAHDEWQRLINVGISRARDVLIVLASRQEMREPYLRPLAQWLTPRVLTVGAGRRVVWEDVESVRAPHAESARVRRQAPTRLGGQIEGRKAMRPVLGAEQQRLCLLPLDGKPRLVRGVAGSGKTAVLAHWLARRVRDQAGMIWVVYANRSLLGLIRSVVESAWRGLEGDAQRVAEGPASASAGTEFPWRRVEFLHVIDLLGRLETERAVPRTPKTSPYDYEARAQAVLASGAPGPRCRAMFVDEAQDLGEATLELLAQLVAPWDPDKPGQRAIHIFYDNAQNVYGRGTPRWIDLGLDMKGRSTVMKESYRSTRPIMEFALNVLHRLTPLPSMGGTDHAELVERDLIHLDTRNERPWWHVRFTEAEGPLPEFAVYASREAELEALVARVTRLIGDDGVRPRDVRVLANTQEVRQQLLGALRVALKPLSARVEERTRDRMDGEDHVVIVSTAHSFKGHDAEIVLVPGAERFVADVDGQDTPLASALYVAMSRARSLLYVSGVADAAASSMRQSSRAILTALGDVAEDQHGAGESVVMCTDGEEELELLSRIGAEHRDWLRALHKRFGLIVGPILAKDGDVLAQPLFTVSTLMGRFACLEGDPGEGVKERLAAVGVQVLRPGDVL